MIESVEREHGWKHASISPDLAGRVRPLRAGVLVEREAPITMRRGLVVADTVKVGSPCARVLAVGAETHAPELVGKRVILTALGQRLDAGGRWLVVPIENIGGIVDDAAEVDQP